MGYRRVIGFAKGLFSKAAPHVSNLTNQAQSHVKSSASKAIESALDTAVDHVNIKLKYAKEQNGAGIKRGKGRRKRKIKTPTQLARLGKNKF